MRWAQWTPAAVRSAVRRYGSMARTASSASLGQERSEADPRVAAHQLEQLAPAGPVEA
ncbi:hypothetical protein ACFQ51_18420 [Streptomyces kaempferi]